VFRPDLIETIFDQATGLPGPQDYSISIGEEDNVPEGQSEYSGIKKKVQSNNLQG
jgi:hypothetical protein